MADARLAEGNIPGTDERGPVVSLKNLKKHFPIKTGVFSRVTGHVKAVDGVTFDIFPGETFGLVGESGCGKSTTGQVILRLIPATSGSVQYLGEDVYHATGERMRRLRKEMQIIFQDPYSALNPRMTVGAAIREILHVHNIAHGREAQKRAEEVLVRCGLEAYHSERYPHEFSGGQRQRVVIARALALDPKFIVADEPISALDVSIQSQIINLLEDLQDEFDLTYLFVSHDLSVVKHIADRVGVMYLGKLVEVAEKKEFYNNPLHPYSRALSLLRYRCHGDRSSTDNGSHRFHPSGCDPRRIRTVHAGVSLKKPTPPRPGIPRYHGA